eukprot:TRINITY_DN228_c1_g3_i1.p1 TRINITY_DN228_c1_g3~~TRINITY_DN228_c1_g3_i1.p1  ORF type:complete len:591 (+),score=231.02 TRINITY_DN228_c1_g3_i1:70-1842(+)
MARKKSGRMAAKMKAMKLAEAKKVEEAATKKTEDKKDAFDLINCTFAENEDKIERNVRDIQVTNFNVNLAGLELLVNAELKLSYGCRYGLLGLNGSGKSTLLKVIGRRLIPIAKSIDIFHLDQEVPGSEMSALEAVLEVDEEKKVLEDEADEITESGDDSDEATDRLMQIYERLDELCAADAESRAAKILHGLGFSPAMQIKKCKDFSGGWRMRIALARALFVNPTCLLLDEPTNHLDMEAVVWLERYLAKFQKILLLVSHSQDFLNNVCSHTIHLQQQKLKYYGGNYDTYVQTRAELEQNQAKRYAWEQEQIRHMKEYIARFGHGSAKLARQAQSKEKTLEKMIQAGLTEAVAKDKVLNLKFEDPLPLPPPVLQMQEVTFGYEPTDLLYQNVDFGVDLESRIVLVGPNGAGKTTLLRLISQELMPLDGQVRHHPHLKLCRYNQHYADVLDLEQTPIEFMMAKFTKQLDLVQTRQFLGRYGLSGKDQMTKIKYLSNGFKCRIVFAYIAKQNPHIMLLDEPTNNLDIETIDALAKAIKDFKGGIVLVSHDMRLIEQVADQIFICDDRTITHFKGSIADYKKVLADKVEQDL